MTDVRRWRNTNHLDQAIDTAGGQEAFDSGLGRMLDEERGWRFEDVRERREFIHDEQVRSD